MRKWLYKILVACRNCFSRHLVHEFVGITSKQFSCGDVDKIAVYVVTEPRTGMLDRVYGRGLRGVVDYDIQAWLHNKDLIEVGFNPR